MYLTKVVYCFKFRVKTHISVGEHGRGADVVPLLTTERVDCLLLTALLASFVAVLADRHDYLADLGSKLN